MKEVTLSARCCTFDKFVRGDESTSLTEIKFLEASSDAGVCRRTSGNRGLRQDQQALAFCDKIKPIEGAAAITMFVCTCRAQITRT